MTYRPVALLALIALAGCSSSGRDSPSFAVRPVEARGWAEPVVVPPPASVDPALDARIVAVMRAVLAADKAFDAAERRAAPLVRAARAASPGSERWIAAETALAELDSRHAAVSDAASTLEDLAATRAEAALPDYPSLTSARANATTLLQREAATIAGLQTMVRPG